MKSSTYFKISLAGILLLTLGFAGLQIYIDPLFHFHAPSEGLSYALFDERYMNDGITRHFEYDSIITGSSMTENFKTSQFDELFGTQSIKIPAAGANYNEINTMLERAFKRNDHITTVMRGLDLTMLIADKDSLSYEEYPDYLYDDNLFNDVYYVLNKDIFFQYTEYTFLFTRLGIETTNFDDYKNWSGSYTYDGDALRRNYERKDIAEETLEFTEEDEELLIGNLEQNVIALAKEHPETEFYLFIPPYSILYWDDIIRGGEFERIMQAHELSLRMLMNYPNIHVYSFFLDISITCTLGYYIDSLHYNQQVSDKIINNMADGTGLITEDNLQFYIDTVRAFYSTFDYDAFMAGE